ncbi:MAG: hypothetical protein Q8N96_08070, partial [Methylovulum sp.]|nr:hypothetical protein [Methylovulum sp.]
FDHIPTILNEPIFQKGFDIAEVSHLSSDQYDAYLKSILSYNEAKAVTDTAFYEGKIDVAKMMLAESFDVETIVRLTKLTVQQIESLK